MKNQIGRATRYVLETVCRLNCRKCKKVAIFFDLRRKSLSFLYNWNKSGGTCGGSIIFWEALVPFPQHIPFDSVETKSALHLIHASHCRKKGWGSKISTPFKWPIFTISVASIPRFCKLLQKSVIISLTSKDEVSYLIRVFQSYLLLFP